MKLVILIDENLPTGLIANTASVLSLTLGKNISNIIGEDLEDSEGNIHAGITKIPIPILKSSKEKLKELRNILFCDEYSECHTVDFCNAAQRTKIYSDYSEAILTSPKENLEYLGIAIYGPKKLVNKLTGSIGLLR